MDEGGVHLLACLPAICRHTHTLPRTDRRRSNGAKSAWGEDKSEKKRENANENPVGKSVRKQVFTR